VTTINVYDVLKPKYGIPHSKSQIDRLVREGKFPQPDGHIGKFAFW
jgi:predicted DNA-binding transcriptional regulator AlpA